MDYQTFKEITIQDYLSRPDRSSLYHGIPIQFLDFVRRIAKEDKTKLRIRYRGPRKHRTGSKYRKQSYCLKRDATTFAIYRRERSWTGTEYV